MRNSFSGILKYDDLSGGIWTLEVGGQKYHLVSSSVLFDAFKDGMSVVVEAEEDKDSMGIGMVGSVLNVTSVLSIG